MLIEIKGQVHEFGVETTNKDGKYPKRNLVIHQENGNYPDYINIEVQERVYDAFKDVKKNDTVNVFANFGGRLWINKEGLEMCFNNCIAWKCDILETAQSEQPATPEEDDLPF